MGQNNLENKIREKLKGHSVHADKEALYEQLGIGSEPKRNRGFVYWIFGACLIGALGFYFFSNGIQQKNSENNDSINHSNISKESIEKEPLTADESINSKYNNTNSLSQTQKNINTQQQESNPNKSTEINPAISSILAASPNSINQTASPTKENINLESNKEAQTLSIANDENQSSSPTSQNLSEDKIAPITTKTKKSSNKLFDPNNIATKEAAEIIIAEIDPQLINHFLINTREITLDYENNFAIEKAINPTKKISSKNAFEISGFYNLYSSQKNFDSSISQEFIDLYSKEIHHENIGFEVLYDRKLNHNFSVQIGGQYSQYNSEFQISKSIDSLGSKQGITNQYVSFEGDTTNTFGFTEFQYSIKRNWVYQNQQIWINLPIYLTYRYLHGQLIYTASTGASVSLHSIAQGDFPNEKLKFNKNINNYRSFGHINLQLKAGMQYRVNRQNALGFNLNYGMSLNDATKNNSLFTDRFRNYGIGIVWCRSL